MKGVAKEIKYRAAEIWLLDFLKEHIPHGARQAHILEQRPEGMTSGEVVTALQRQAAKIVLLSSRIREEGFSAGGNQRWHLKDAPHNDGSLCADCFATKI